jgi:dTDP-4-amino-4,6-dideoxygalactose transaminase
MGKTSAPALLALDGGVPVRESFLPFGSPSFGEEEIAEVVATLRSGWIGTGPRVLQFERDFARYVGAKHAVAVNSCSAALHLSLIALRIGPGDEVITTPLTFAATANVIEHCGARPVFADIDPETFNLDPGKLEAAITPRTRAILPVHFGGQPCEMDAIMDISQKHGIPVVEDAAHAIGSCYHDRPIGSMGNLTCFSFYANKNLTTGEGGMATTNDSRVAERLRVLRLHGLTADAWKRFSAPTLIRTEVLEPGFKYNMPDIAAAIGIHQLRKQEPFFERRRQIAMRYDSAFAGLPIRRQLARDSEIRHSLHLYAVLLDEGCWTSSRDEVVEALLGENIGAAIHYRPLHMHHYYAARYGYQAEDFPNALAVGSRILTLPLTPGMSDQDADDVVRAFRKVAAARTARVAGAHG